MIASAAMAPPALPRPSLKLLGTPAKISYDADIHFYTRPAGSCRRSASRAPSRARPGRQADGWAPWRWTAGQDPDQMGLHLQAAGAVGQLARATSPPRAPRPRPCWTPTAPPPPRWRRTQGRGGVRAADTIRIGRPWPRRSAGGVLMLSHGSVRGGFAQGPRLHGRPRRPLRSRFHGGPAGGMPGGRDPSRLRPRT